MLTRLTADDRRQRFPDDVAHIHLKRGPSGLDPGGSSEKVMARSGDVLSNRAGHQLIFRHTADETGGALLEVEALYPPHSQAPTEHYHPSQEERFEILEGEIRASIDGHVTTYKAGDVFTRITIVAASIWFGLLMILVIISNQRAQQFEDTPGASATTSATACCARSAPGCIAAPHAAV